MTKIQYWIYNTEYTIYTMYNIQYWIDFIFVPLKLNVLKTYGQVAMYNLKRTLLG